MCVDVTHSVLSQVVLTTCYPPGTALGLSVRQIGSDLTDKARGFPELADSEHGTRRLAE